MKKFSAYTLIEILIVMVIISIVASTALLTIHFNHNKQCEDFANQLVDLISLAENDALLRQKVFGIAFTTGAMQFFEWDEKTYAWLPAAEKIFRDKKFLDGLQLHLSIRSAETPLDGKPRIIISGVDDTPAFVISLGEKNHVLYKVIGEENGRVYVK